MLPTKQEAEQLLTWAHQQNPGPWANHSRIAARVAETIAEKCNLDTHRAYVSGLLHDIGRYEGVTNLHHVYAGYKLMMDKGYNQIAEICMTHSFPAQNFKEFFGVNDCTPEESNLIESFISNKTYNEYDKLIQLCDTIGSADGVCLMEVRMINVIRRYGFTSHTTNKIEAIFNLKTYFDNKCNMNIYDLFYDEIRDVSFR